MARDRVPLQYIVLGPPDEPLSGVWANVSELLALLDVRMVGESDGRVAALLDLKLELEDLVEKAGLEVE